MKSTLLIRVLTNLIFPMHDWVLQNIIIKPITSKIQIIITGHHKKQVLAYLASSHKKTLLTCKISNQFTQSIEMHTAIKRMNTLKNPWLDVCSTILLKPFQAHLSSRLFLCEKNECETQYRHLALFSSPF